MYEIVSDRNIRKPWENMTGIIYKVYAEFLILRQFLYFYPFFSKNFCKETRW